MKKNKKKTGFILKLFLVLNLIVVLFLILSYLALYVSPKTFWPLQFAGLAYPYILAANFLFVVFWIFFRIKFTLISLIPVLLGYNYILSMIQYNAEKKILPEQKIIKVISYNVQNFDIYNYDKNWKSDILKRNRIFDFIREEAPNIICFQEFVYDTSGAFKTTDTIITLGDFKNVHAEYTFVSRKVNKFGLATFTSYPIVRKGRIDFPNSKNNLCIFTDMLIDGDTVRVYNAHFQSIKLKEMDYETAESITTGKPLDEPELKKKSMRLIRMLKRAFEKRAVQTEMVAEHIRKCPYPIILCTDLNDTPVSYAYHQIASELKDAFKQAGNGLGSTFDKIYPSFRIDYIFISKHFRAYNFRRIPSDNSDHYPVVCLIEKKNK